MTNILNRIFGDRETRGSLEDPNVPVSNASILGVFGINPGDTVVSYRSAMGIPAVFCAVNFLAGTMAHLPLHTMRTTGGKTKRVHDGPSSVLSSISNDETSAFDVRKMLWDSVFLEGRGLAYLEKNSAGQVLNMFPLELSKTSIRRNNGRLEYENQRGKSKHTYAAHEVIDLAFMRTADGIGHFSPIMVCASAMAAAINTNKFGEKLFAGGGIPPLAVESPSVNKNALERTADDISGAMAKAFNKGKKAIALPPGHKLTPLKNEPQSLQMVEFQKFLVEQVARVYGLPPMFLQDLTNAHFSNAEQQDLHVTKHVFTRWTKQAELQFGLKFFGRAEMTRANGRRVKHNIDGLLRGDFTTRMEGYSKAIQNGVITPDEARSLEDRPAMGGDAGKLHIQGATVPLGEQPKKSTETVKE